MAYRFQISGYFLRVTDTVTSDILINETRESIKWTKNEDGNYQIVFKSPKIDTDIVPSSLFVVGSYEFAFADIVDESDVAFASATVFETWISTYIGYICCSSVEVEVNGTSEGTIPCGTILSVEVTDGVDPVTPDSVSLVGDTLTMAINASSAWKRPSDWLEIDSLSSVGDEMVVGLFGVFDGRTNDVAVQIGGVNYTVDWGDGTVDTFSAGALTPTHTYDFATVSASTLTSEGFKQVIIKIYPTNPVDTFNSYIYIDRQSALIQNWLDVRISAPSATAFTIGQSRYNPWLRKFNWLGTHTNSINLSSQFDYADIHQFGFDFSNVLTSANCFQHNPNDITDVNGNPLSMNITSSGGIPTLQAMFEGSKIKKFGTLSASIQISAVTQMFNGSSLEEIGTIDFNGALLPSLQTMFNTCYSLRGSVVINNVPNITQAISTFNSCKMLDSFYIQSSSALTNISGIASYCIKLSSVEITDCSGITTTTNCFIGTSNLQSVTLTGITVGFSVANNQMSATAINNMFTALGTASGAQTVTVTGNPGASTCDTTIATAKGWTVLT